MDVYWREQTEADVPDGNQWLSANEMLCLSGMRVAKRRNDWRLGRWTAKLALTECLCLSDGINALANIEIRPAASGAPEAFLFDKRAAVTISLSHRAGAAVCAVALSSVSLGCDLELVEPREPGFVSDYFTVNEQSQFDRTSAQQQPLLVTLFWSAKESALKALRVGLRVDTRCLEVCLEDDPLQQNHDGGRNARPVLLPLLASGWRPLEVRYADAQVFHGWWRHSDHMVRTVVSAVPLCSPYPTRTLLCPLPAERVAEDAMGRAHN
jgi:4'-phosphopantetheinyl transferase